MIIIFEPQCRGFEHEQFNAGFLHGYSLKYPNETIIFFAEKDHIRCVQNVLYSAKITLTEVKYVETKIPESNSLAKLGVIFQYYKILKCLLQFASENHCNRLVFLSIYTFNLIPLKILLQYHYHNYFQVHIGMHGILESIRRKNVLTPIQFVAKVANRFRRFLKLNSIDLKLVETNKYIYEKLFRSSLQFFNNQKIIYYVFREDSREKLKSYLPRAHVFFSTVDLPYIYKEQADTEKLSRLDIKIFATVGHGNLHAVNEVVRKIAPKICSHFNFEVRIIGGNPNQGVPNSERIRICGASERLTRMEIEEEIEDVQYVLFFCNKEAYKLTTSGSFFDAIAYCKPMIFLTNPCFDYYYEKYRFGYRCESIDEVVVVIQNILSGYGSDYLHHVSEIKRMQYDISISNNFHKLRFES